MSHESCEVLDQLGKFLYQISPALVTVAFGGVLVQRFFVRRANEGAFIDLLIRDIEILRADSLEYWNTPNSPDSRKRRRQVLAQKMKGAIKSLSADLRFYCERYCVKHEKIFNELMAEISDACTGGSFESASAGTDSGRYLLIVNATNRLKSALHRQKL
jgi:hypothetical protein